MIISSSYAGFPWGPCANTRCSYLIIFYSSNLRLCPHWCSLLFHQISIALWQAEFTINIALQTLATFSTFFLTLSPSSLSHSHHLSFPIPFLLDPVDAYQARFSVYLDTFAYLVCFSNMATNTVTQNWWTSRSMGSTAITTCIFLWNPWHQSKQSCRVIRHYLWARQKSFYFCTQTTNSKLGLKVSPHLL